METDYIYPIVGDRRSPNEWTEKGKLDANDLASRKLKEILATHYPRHVSDAVDDAVRASGPVKLPREAMRP